MHLIQKLNGKIYVYTLSIPDLQYRLLEFRTKIVDEKTINNNCNNNSS